MALMQVHINVLYVLSHLPGPISKDTRGLIAHITMKVVPTLPAPGDYITGFYKEEAPTQGTTQEEAGGFPIAP